jgi:hypothetical protein
MKNKLSKLLQSIYNVSLWRWTVLGMISILLAGAVYYFMNFFESARPYVTISKLELKKGEINKDLSQTDEVEASATAEEYASKLNSLKSKIPKAEWNLTQKELSEDEYKKIYDESLDNWFSYKQSQATLASFGMDSPDIEWNVPSKIIYYKYSMKAFLKDLFDKQEIDSLDYDAQILVLEKVDHFLSMADKKGADTLLVDKFKGVLENSKNLTLDEIKAVEKLHKSITKTSPVFSLTKINSPKERQEQLFKLYEVAANGDITPARFEQMEKISSHLKNKIKLKDTVAVLNLISTAMSKDFSTYKEKDESVDALEMQCAEDFFFGGKIDYKAEDVEDRFEKFSTLFGEKLEAANLEKRAREILRTENRVTGKDWMYFGFFFTCLSVMIVFLSKLNTSLKTLKNN